MRTITALAYRSGKTPHYDQLYAQIKHYFDDPDFVYCFKNDRQEELNAYNAQFENNTDEYNALCKYARKCPSHALHLELQTVVAIIP